MLMKLYILRQPMLSRSTTDCLEMLCSSRNSHLGAAALGELLQQVLQQEAAWDKKDTDLVLALTKLIETGFIRFGRCTGHFTGHCTLAVIADRLHILYWPQSNTLGSYILATHELLIWYFGIFSSTVWSVRRLHELDASVCGMRLPQAFHSLLPQLCAEQEGVRFGSQQALKNLIHDCMDDAMINTAVSRGSMGSAAMPPAQNVVLAVANTLTVHYQDGWVNALSGNHSTYFIGLWLKVWESVSSLTACAGLCLV